MRDRVLLALDLEESHWEAMMGEEAADLAAQARGPASADASSRRIDRFLSESGAGRSIYFYRETLEVSYDVEVEVPAQAVAAGMRGGGAAPPDKASEEEKAAGGEDPADGGATLAEQGGAHAAEHEGPAAVAARAPAEREAAPRGAAGEADADADADAVGSTPADTDVDAARIAPAEGKAPQGFRVMRTETRAASKLHCSLHGLPPSAGASTRSVYFIRTEEGAIKDATEGMAHLVEYGVHTGDSLNALSRMISSIFIPLVDASSTAGGAGGADLERHPSAAKVLDASRSEFRSSIHKFEQQVVHAIRHVQGDVQLQVPDVAVDLDDAQGLDCEASSALERAMVGWTRLIGNVVEEQSKRQPRGPSPMAEIEFWRNRNAALGALYEQINMPNVQAILEALRRQDVPTLPAYAYNYSELSKQHAEAKDNVKFLNTLERHFKNIAQGDFAAILDTLPSMMNAIRMVWIISRYYNKDERMTPLMERIAWQISDKVSREINVASFLGDPECAAARVREAIQVLQAWPDTYNHVRKVIEDSDSPNRWEFSRAKLFERTNHMKNVCENLLEVVTTLADFQQFLGPELRAVTGESQGIDDIIAMVEALQARVEDVPFDIFNKHFDEPWRAVMHDFRGRKAEVDRMTREFIEQSFQKLRSAEAAFDLVQNFRNIQSRESINQHINERYHDILTQYQKELDHIRAIWEAGCPLGRPYKNFPEVAGAIKWAWDLYQRAKKPILRFKKHENLLNSDFGEEVKQRYLSFARDTDAYMRQLFADWKECAQAVVMEKLKQPILATDHVAYVDAENKGRIEGIGAQTTKVKVPMPPYRVNFSQELSKIIRESKYLDRMGFPVPESALLVTLQEEKYHSYIQRMQQMLNTYHGLLDSLSVVERGLLQEKLGKLREHVAHGFAPLNWTSQRIPNYIDSCNQELNEFTNIVSQVHKSSTMIAEVVDSIEETSLITEADFQTAAGEARTIDVSQFYDLLEAKRIQRVEGLAQRYRDMNQLLIKIEEVAVGTNTGTSAILKGYYHYWEKRIFNAITKMVVTSMATLLAVLEAEARSAPLCVVKATLNGKDVVLSPTLMDVQKIFRNSVNNLVESTKAFQRWMDGTCLITEPQAPANEDEEPIVYSFYDDVLHNPPVHQLVLSVLQAIGSTTDRAQRYLDTWRWYDKKHKLWDPKRRQHFDKLLDKNPDAAHVEGHLAQYATLAEEVWDKRHDKDINFLRIDCSHVAAGVRDQAEEWKRSYGEVLHQGSRSMLTALQERMAQLERDLRQEPEDLDVLKFVLGTISTVADETMDSELLFTDIAERYRVCERYRIAIPEGEAEAARTLSERWHRLFCDSKTKDLRLQQVKEQFREVTKDQAVEFKASTKQMLREFLDAGPGISSISLEDGSELLDQYITRLAECSRRKQELVNAEGLFNLEITAYPALAEMSARMDQLSVIYALYREQHDFEETNSNMLWSELDVAALTRGAEDLEKRCRRMPKELKELHTFRNVQSRVTNFKDSIPLIVNLKNDAMKERHWKALMEVTGVIFDMNPKTLTLQNIFAMELHNFAEKIAEIVNEAVQEQKIENELRKIEQTWSRTVLSMARYKKNGQDRGFVLRSAEDIKQELEDNMLNLQTMSSSRFVGSFVDRVRAWEKSLNVVNECLDVWFVVQRKWMYLESIFVGAEDIRLQLPEEAKKFDQIDKAFKTIMAATHKNPNAVEACTADSRLETLKNLSDRLDKCQKSLSDYLNTKRSAFPRFYFVSDDELLSVLGSSDPAAIQVHMLKLFDNVKELLFGRAGKAVAGMRSSEAESFDFVEPTLVDGAVETWMTAAEGGMVQSLWSITKEGVFRYASEERTRWITESLGMVTLAGSQIWWTWEVENAFHEVAGGNKYAMKQLEARLTGQLNDLVAMVRRPLAKLVRKKVNTLLIIDVHARDIVDSFVRNSILNQKEFAWESQLRFYWDRDVDNCLIRQCTGQFQYGYEYMGCNGRLVITPLTDRCYMTLTQALTFKLGGSPAGPAGTGKTETTKDLSKSLALACYVINCGEGLDYQAMASIFTGLCSVGAWGCFDEFNRINIEVLSVVSAQLRAIQDGLVKNWETVDIGVGSEVRIKRVAGFATCGFFITMNPGYAGRTELPDNLKALFRPVTMIVPDLQQICEIMLFSEGFEEAKLLAKKMTVLYRLARGQLSKQFHYDFGLRALKSVLVMAGDLKRGSPDLSEDVVLMRALRDSNMPKYVFEDVPLFLGLVNDLFPGLDCPRVGYAALKDAVVADLEERGFRHTDDEVFMSQVDKCIQMYETQIVRHTTMIVGPTGGGKSLVLETLKNARDAAEGVTVKMFVLNPKAQPLHELYGLMDPVSRDWTDGILSRLFREVNQPLPPGKEKEMRWIIYDGDVDALWVENMNSVMDDNKLLTLPNGERIRLQPHCAMICETFDLQYASPATISRCGMVWVDPKNLGYRPLYERWVRLRFGDGVTVPEGAATDAQEYYMRLFDRYVPACVDYVLNGVIEGEAQEKLAQVIPITSIDMVKQLCSAMDAYWPFAEEDDPADHVRSATDNMFLYCIVWSAGAVLADESRVRFERFLKEKSDLRLPDESLFDAFFNREDERWVPWSDVVPDYQQPNPFRFYDITVPTTDMMLYSNLLDRLAARKPILFVGESGTAKTLTIQNYLASLDAETNSSLVINFSSRTSSRDVQTNIEANIDKRAGNVYGPPTGKTLNVFVDDMNMPKVDTYGTQQPVTFLLFLMGRGAMYDRGKDLNLKLVRDCSYMCAMGPPGGGRNSVDPRFVALFNVFSIASPTNFVLDAIYSRIAEARFLSFPGGVRAAAAKFTGAALRLYNFVVEKLPPTPSKFHYIWNLRDLSRVFEGVCLATEDTCGSGAQVVRLFRNECLRVFCDRLTTSEDAALVARELRIVLEETFAEDEAAAALAEPILFGDYRFAPERLAEDKEDPRLYEDLGGFDTISAIFAAVLENYNMEHKTMDLVLFQQALEHLTRVHRIIRMPRGNALLIGVGGSGKQSLTKVAAYCAGYDVFEITLVRNYGEHEFREDLKELYKALGKKEVVFLFTDAHVADEGFLEFLNNMLTVGMPAALYEQDEKDALINSVRNEVAAAGLMQTPEVCWRYYVNKARNNLHIVLSMSPSGEKLRVRCRNFPGLVSSTAIDWFFPWPAEALGKVAEHFLREDRLFEEHRGTVVSNMVFAHQTVLRYAARFTQELRRFYSVTPKNYLDFIRNYRAQIAKSNRKVQGDVQRLQGGLTKLIEAAEAVDRMQADLTEKKIVVDAKTEDVQGLITVIEEKTKIATEQQAEATVKQEEAAAMAIRIAEESAAANSALEEALPAVEAAAAALENLDKDSVTEVRGFTNPPVLVKATVALVAVLRPTGERIDPDSWVECKKMLGTPGLLDLLKNYPKDSITERQMREIRKYRKASPTLSAEGVRPVSKAGWAMMVWVEAICKYYEVAKNVEPLRNKVREMEMAKQKTDAELATLQTTLAAIEKELGELNVQYEAANGELSELQHQAAIMEKRLAAASKLISGLTGERTRWTTDVESLRLQARELVGNCLLSASFLSYLGAFTNTYRAELLEGAFLPKIRDSGLPLTEPFKLNEMLVNDAAVQGWTAKGLPADNHSVQNGILTMQSSRFPLCIDPQQQAVAWIKNTYADQNLTVKSLNDADFIKHLELAIQFGNPFLFENIDEELDPMLDPVLEKDLVEQNGARQIVLGDKVVDWDDNFKLFFTTKLSNPQYSPEVMGKTMLINYGVTMDGLADQLLNVVVAHERPDLEEEFASLVTEMSENAQLLVSLEDSLLRELSNSQGNILDNEELIATLEETKTKAVEIQGKLEQATFTKDEISKARAQYMPVAKRGSIMYFAEAGLATVMRMYEISLDTYLSVFNQALDSAKRDVVLDNRLRNMTNSITHMIYDYTCTGIFERHKLMFSFQMTCMIMDGDGKLDHGEVDFFLKGDTALEGPSKPCPAPWLSAAGWKDLICLAALEPVFAELVAAFEANAKDFEDWYDLEAPEMAPLPQGLGDSISPMQRLCVMRCFRPDRVYNAVKLFVMETLGEKYVQPPVLDYARVFGQSAPSMPMIFILSPGADPQADIQLLADERGMSAANKFKYLALGQGQGPLAEQMLDAGMSRGFWVLLQNVHLLASWLKTLEKKLEVSKAPHPDFRLWLTTAPTDKFPLGILQRSLKVVTEPPDGLKLNMRSTFAKIDDAMLEECPHEAFRPCLYVLVFLHAVVQERKKYGKIGWNVAYDFNESDFNISRRLLSLYLTKAYVDDDEFLPWGSLKYLIGDAMYGGRVSDDMDRRVLKTYLEEYMGDFLFDDCQKFFFSQSGFDYELPEHGPLSNYRDEVEKLPLTNSPAVFGLHPNAEIQYYTETTRAMWRDLISLQPRTAGGGGGGSREDYIAQLASDILARIPLESMDLGSYDLILIRKGILDRNGGSSPTPCQVVLLQELERWNKLVIRMASSLTDLGKALIGEIGMSDELDALGESLFNGYLPELWRKLAPDTEKLLGGWMNHFTRRYQQYEAWIRDGEPAAIWLSGLAIPESYLTALVQTTCRKRNWPLDKSTLYTVVTEHTSAEGLERLASGCYVVGLHLEGASWDLGNRCLRRQDPKVLVTELPVLQVIPIEAARLKLHGTFKAPVYVTSARANARGVGSAGFSADLRTDLHPSLWVLQGVACTLETR